MPGLAAGCLIWLPRVVAVAVGYVGVLSNVVVCVAAVVVAAEAGVAAATCIVGEEVEGSPR